MYGIDVSHHNGAISWTNVKTSEVKFAILRAGYGIYDSQKGRKVKSTTTVRRRGDPSVGAISTPT